MPFTLKDYGIYHSIYRHPAVLNAIEAFFFLENHVTNEGY